MLYYRDKFKTVSPLSHITSGHLNYEPSEEAVALDWVIQDCFQFQPNWIWTLVVRVRNWWLIIPLFCIRFYLIKRIVKMSCQTFGCIVTLWSMCLHNKAGDVTLRNGNQAGNWQLHTKLRGLKTKVNVRRYVTLCQESDSNWSINPYLCYH